MGMRAATRSEWKWWPEREDATLRALAGVGQYADHALSAPGGAVKRRALTWKEQTASAGAYTARNLVFLVPDENLPTGVKPQAGFLIVDGAAVSHTVLEVVAGKFGNTHRCTTIALALAYALSETGTLERPDNTQDAAGRMALTSYSAVGTSRCRVQPQDRGAAEVMERKTMPLHFTAFLETPLAARARDRFVCAGTTYTVTGVRNPERLDALQELTLERVL